MTDKINIALLGADGRMGVAVSKVLASRADTILTAALTASDSPQLGQSVNGHDISFTDDFEAALARSDVLIDFSSPSATLKAAAMMNRRHCRAMVSGTTGLSAVQEASLETFSDGAAMLRSGNFSLGVNLLEVLVENAAKALKAGWDIEVLEMHHRHKVDAPSGTALMLGEAAAAGRGVRLSDVQVLSREGQTGARKAGDIGFSVLRGGGVIGAHEVRIASELEMITLGHDAFDRSVFAEGAVSAAIWAAKQKPGFYSMRDMLGL